jgi:hypothetical protein
VLQGVHFEKSERTSFWMDCLFDGLATVGCCSEQGCQMVGVFVSFGIFITIWYILCLFGTKSGNPGSETKRKTCYFNIIRGKFKFLHQPKFFTVTATRFIRVPTFSLIIDALRP